MSNFYLSSRKNMDKQNQKKQKDTLNNNYSGRIEWIDYAKGLAIIFVVYGHVLIGIYNSKFNINSTLYIYTIKFIYSFHMPVFFFLSGIFAIKSCSVKFPIFLIKKCKTIVYPYLVWSLIQGCIYALMSPFTNFKFDIGDLPTTIAFNPLMQFWFLYVLFFLQIFFFAINRFCGKYSYYILSATALIIYLLSGYVKINIVSKICQFFVFYVLGAILGREFNFQNYLNLNKFKILFFSILLLILELILVDLNGRIDYIGNPLKSLFLACMGITLIISLSIYISKKPTMEFISYIGKRSLPIYLIHILVIVGFRIIISKFFGINDIIIHLIIGMLSGIFLPIIIYDFLANKIKFSYLLFYGK